MQLLVVADRDVCRRVRRSGDFLPTAFGFYLCEQVLVARLAEQIAGVQVALAPGFLCRLGQLPVVEAGAQAAGDRLMLQCPLIVPEAIVSQTHGFRKEPTVSVVLGQEGLDSSFAIATMLKDLFFQVVESNQSKNCQAQFRRFCLVDTPETPWGKINRFRSKQANWQIALGNNIRKIT